MRRIVIIQDEKDILLSIKSLLRKKGFKVSTFTDWRKALENIRKNKPQLVVLDVFLKNFDGLEVCNKLRSHPITRRLPVLAFSSLPKVADTAIHEFGANDFIVKPFALPNFMEKNSGSRSFH